MNPSMSVSTSTSYPLPAVLLSISAHKADSSPSFCTAPCILPAQLIGKLAGASTSKTTKWFAGCSGCAGCLIQPYMLHGCFCVSGCFACTHSSDWHAMICRLRQQHYNVQQDNPPNTHVAAIPHRLHAALQNMLVMHDDIM